MKDKCPGSIDLRTPTLKIKNCPECDSEVELFSNDRNVTCGSCGFIIYNNITSCVQWCSHAKECVGEEVYNKTKSK